MCCPFLPMMAPTAWAGMNTCTISCSGACCQDRACYQHRPRGTARKPLHAPAMHPQEGRGAGTQWPTWATHSLAPAMAGKRREEGRALPTSLAASEMAFHGAEVPGTMREHPQTSLPSPCDFLTIRVPQGVGLFQGGHTRGQVSPVIRPRTYHKGAVGSGSGDAAGRWRDCTGRGWEETHSSQVQARDEMRLQLGKEGEEEVSLI